MCDKTDRSIGGGGGGAQNFATTRCIARKDLKMCVLIVDTQLDESITDDGLD